MNSCRLAYWPLLVCLSFLTACTSHTPFSTDPITLEDDSTCPLDLRLGQKLTLKLPHEPEDGLHWRVLASAQAQLDSISPGLYTAANAEHEGYWSQRFMAVHTGSGQLLLSYQRPWEEPQAAAGSFDCRVRVED